IEARHRRPLAIRLRRRLALAVLPYPSRLRLALAPLRLLERVGMLALARRLQSRLPARWRYRASLLPNPLAAAAAVPIATPARGAERAHVQLLVGCVMPELFGDTVRSTLDVLARNGCWVTAPTEQACCGALALHAGDRAAAT